MYGDTTTDAITLLLTSMLSLNDVIETWCFAYTPSHPVHYIHRYTHITVTRQEVFRYRTKKNGFAGLVIQKAIAWCLRSASGIVDMFCGKLIENSITVFITSIWHHELKMPLNYPLLTSYCPAVNILERSDWCNTIYLVGNQIQCKENIFKQKKYLLTPNSFCKIHLH